MDITVPALKVIENVILFLFLTIVLSLTCHFLCEKHWVIQFSFVITFFSLFSVSPRVYRMVMGKKKVTINSKGINEEYAENVFIPWDEVTGLYFGRSQYENSFDETVSVKVSKKWAMENARGIRKWLRRPVFGIKVSHAGMDKSSREIGKFIIDTHNLWRQKMLEEQSVEFPPLTEETKILDLRYFSEFRKKPKI